MPQHISAGLLSTISETRPKTIERYQSARQSSGHTRGLDAEVQRTFFLSLASYGFLNQRDLFCHLSFCRMIMAPFSMFRPILPRRSQPKNKSVLTLKCSARIWIWALLGFRSPQLKTPTPTLPRSTRGGGKTASDKVHLSSFPNRLPQIHLPLMQTPAEDYAPDGELFELADVFDAANAAAGDDGDFAGFGDGEGVG
jgi:hypothetical protein